MDNSISSLSAVSSRPGVGRSLVAGLVSGILGGFAANLVWLLLGAPAGTEMAPVGVAPIIITTLVLNLVGGLVFYALARWTSRPIRNFVILGIVFATAYSAMVLVTPDFASFAWVLVALHYVAAAVALVAIPRLTGASGR
ncbi:MAG TPA: DUF6069 family protein [Chloroflexota bacterium]|nr:DUF6069 family protein [Chloroflexota bacterium]